MEWYQKCQIIDPNDQPIIEGNYYMWGDKLYQGVRVVILPEHAPKQKRQPEVKIQESKSSRTHNKSRRGDKLNISCKKRYVGTKAAIMRLSKTLQKKFRKLSSAVNRRNGNELDGFSPLTAA